MVITTGSTIDLVAGIVAGSAKGIGVSSLFLSSPQAAIKGNTSNGANKTINPILPDIFIDFLDMTI